MNDQDKIIQLGTLPRRAIRERGKIVIKIEVYQDMEGLIQIRTKREGEGNHYTQMAGKGLWDAIALAGHALEKATKEQASVEEIRRKDIENQANKPTGGN